MKQFFCLLAIVTYFSLVSSQGIPSMPGVIDLKEPDLKVTPVRHYSNTSVVELKDPGVEENIVKKEEENIFEREEENIIEEEEVGPVERAKEEILEKEEEHSVEKEGEPSTEVIPIDPEENVIFYIPDFGKEEEEEDILIDTDKSDEPEVAGDVNDFEEIDLKEYYHPHSVTVNPLEHEVVDYPHLSDSDSDKEDILIDTDKSDEPEVAEGTNDLGGTHLLEEEDSPSVAVNHLEYEVTDKPPLADTSDIEDIIIDSDKSDEPEVAEGTNDLGDSHPLEEDSSPVNVNHLEYEVTDKPPLGDITDDDDLFDLRDDDGHV